MPEFAATMPSSPFPATTVAIITGCSEFKWLEWCSVETGHSHRPCTLEKDSKTLYSAAIPCLSLSRAQQRGRSLVLVPLPETIPIRDGSKVGNNARESIC